MGHDDAPTTWMWMVIGRRAVGIWEEFGNLAFLVIGSFGSIGSIGSIGTRDPSLPNTDGRKGITSAYVLVGSFRQFAKSTDGRQLATAGD